jgi:hypothetical protein
MSRTALAFALWMAALGSVAAQETCKAQAVGSDSRPLAGAALKSFMAKCTKEACEPKAVGSNGKPLVGAAKASFMKKCQGTS